jgi:hypothetical protein
MQIAYFWETFAGLLRNRAGIDRKIEFVFKTETLPDECIPEH